MSDITDFQAAKQKAETSLPDASRENLTLHSILSHDQQMNSSLANRDKDERNLLISSLAIADVRAEHGDSKGANIFFNEAMELMKSAKMHGQDTTQLTQIADQVAKDLKK